MKVLDALPAEEDSYRVTALVEGDFPGGRVELGYTFRLHDGLISSLSIG
jgi:hypothetical protein